MSGGVPITIGWNIYLTTSWDISTLAHEVYHVLTWNQMGLTPFYTDEAILQAEFFVYRNTPTITPLRVIPKRGVNVYEVPDKLSSEGWKLFGLMNEEQRAVVIEKCSRGTNFLRSRTI